MKAQSYHASLEACVNGEVGGGWLGAINRAFRFRSAIRNCAANLPKSAATPADERRLPLQSIRFARYAGTNPNVLAMARFLADCDAFDDVVCATVHGSLAQRNEIEYSDFDALLIVRNATLMDPIRLSRLSYNMAKARAIMHQQDPLQHHGWFVLPEFMLQHYPDRFLPVATLKQSVSLGDATEIEFHPVWGGSSFDGLAVRTIQEIRSGRFLRNLYQFKSCLSKFMLLPAAFVQAKLGRGIAKEDSFDQIRDAMGDSSQVMDKVSNVRANWKQPHGTVLRFVAQSPLWSRSLGAKRVAPKVPSPIHDEFPVAFRSEMVAYIQKMSSLLQAEALVLVS